MNKVLLKTSVCSLLLAAGMVACSGESKQEKPVTGEKGKAGQAPQPKKAEAESEKKQAVVERKSIFEDPTRAPYTDPFFPQSARIRPVPVEGTPAPRSTASIDQIILKGVSGTDGKRFALINRRTFAAGESGTVQTPRGPVNIEVLEVKERSAIIKLENDPDSKEIYLRPEP